MRTPKNRNTVFTPLSYESVFSHLNRLEIDIELNGLTNSYRRQVPVYVCTIIEQFCRTRKKFAYGSGEPMPREIRLNMPLVMDMLDWSDSWCTDNVRRHEEALRKHVNKRDKDTSNDGSFRISVGDLHVLIDDACDIRPPLVVESLAASTLSFQGVDDVNSLDITKQILHPEGGIGVDEYDALFETRHTKTHTLDNARFSPRACVALAKDLFEHILGRDDFMLYRGRAWSAANMHASAANCLMKLRGRTDWEYLSCYGRSLAHVGGVGSGDMLDLAVDSLQGNVEAISKHKTNEAAWLRMEAARAMCDLADGFRAVGRDYESRVSEALKICSDLADAYWLVGDRLSDLGLSPHASLKCFRRAYDLERNVDTAYAVGIEYFKRKMYQYSRKWLKKAASHDAGDKDVKHALEQVEIHLDAAASKTKPH